MRPPQCFARDRRDRGVRAELFDRGVHYAPWCPWDHPDGFHLVAINDEHCLVASMESPRRYRRTVSETRVVRTPRRLLPAKTTAYKDQYDDGFEDEDMTGEDWKSGGGR